MGITCLVCVFLGALVGDFDAFMARFIFIRVGAHQALDTDQDTLQALGCAPVLALCRNVRWQARSGTAKQRTCSPRQVPGAWIS